MSDFVVRLACGNCGEKFWCRGTDGLAALTVDLYEHWCQFHITTQVHLPSVHVYIERASQGEAR